VYLPSFLLARSADLVEKAGADPNRKGKCSDSPDEREQLPLEVALSHSTPDEGFWDPGTARGLLVMTLIELGARLDLLMESGDPDCLRLVNRWLSDTIMNYDCHGSLLEKIIISLRPSVLDMGTTCDPSVCPHSDRIRTPIGAALATKYTRGVRVLVEAGANVNTSLCSKCVTRFTDEQEAPLGLMSREAPLLLALATGQWEAAEVWVRAGADTRVVWERWGFGNLPSCLRECPASLLALMRPDFILSEGTGQSG